MQKEKLKDVKQKLSPNLFYTKHTVQNACGTVGIIHSLANNKSHFHIESEAFFLNLKYLYALILKLDACS